MSLRIFRTQLPRISTRQLTTTARFNMADGMDKSHAKDSQQGSIGMLHQLVCQATGFVDL